MNALLQPGIVGRHTRFAENEHGKAGHVTVARRVFEFGFSPQLFRTITAAPLFRRGKGADGPAAVLALVLPKHFNQFRTAFLRQQILHARSRPQQHYAAVVIGRRGFAQIFLQRRHTGFHFVILQSRPPTRRSRHRHGSDSGFLKGARFKRRPAIQRTPRAGLALNGKHQLKGGFCFCRKFLGHMPIPFRQASRNVNDLGGLRALIEVSGLLLG